MPFSNVNYYSKQFNSVSKSRKCENTDAIFDICDNIVAICYS